MSSLTENELTIIVLALSQMREKIVETTGKEPEQVNGLLNKASDHLHDLQAVEAMQNQTGLLPI